MIMFLTKISYRLAFVCWISKFGYPFPGNFKAVSKVELSRMPFIGWILSLSEFLFIKRSWKDDHLRYIEKLRSLCTYSETGFPLWILIFPEGTRATQKKLEASQNFARSKGLTVFNHLLYPRLKGFLGLIPIMRNSLDYVVDCNISYEGNPPSLVDIFSGISKNTIYFHVRKFEIETIPHDPSRLKNWIVDRWLEKEDYFSQSQGKSELSQNSLTHENASTSYMPFYIMLLTSSLTMFFTYYVSFHIKNGIPILITSQLSILFISAIVMVSSLRPSSRGL